MMIKKSLVPLLTLLLFINMGCGTRQEKDFNLGVKYLSRNEFILALNEFNKAMKREPGNLTSLRAARESLKILLYELKNYEKAIEVLRFLILYSNNQGERWKAQSQISEIYFDNLAWYDKALVEYSKLLSGHHSIEERIRVRLAIARCYYYLGQFLQAWNEAKSILNEQDISEDQVFDLHLIQANINQSLKKFTEAAKGFEKLIVQFPDRSKKENIGINLTLCYEELGLHKEALKVLETMKEYYKPREYIDLRIKKIKDRLLNQPKKRIKK